MMKNEEMAICLAAGVPFEYTYETLPNGDMKIIATTKYPVGITIINGQPTVMVKKENTND